MKLKKFEQKDRYGNMFSIEFDTSIPEMSTIPDHPGDPKGPDTVPAWLTPGEFVMNAEAVRMFEPQIEQMNNAGRAIQAEQGGTIPEYAAEGTKVSLPKSRPERPEIPAVDPQQLYKMLRARNFTDNAARGIIANFSAESNLKPDARQLGGGPGMGLAQWESGGRFDTDPLNLVDFSHKRGTNWADPETQLDFMLAEMDNSDEYGGVRDAINAAESPAAAAKMFLEGYEKANPKHKTYPASMENRMQFASNFQPAQEEPTMLASLMSMFGTKEAQAETVPAMDQASIPQPDININSATPVLTAMTGKTMPITSTIADMLSAARTQYKAPGGLVDDPEADAIQQLTELAQQATATQGSYIGDEVLEEGGADYDAARHAEEIRMRREMAQQAEDSAQANEFAMSAPPVIDNLGPDTTVPSTVIDNVGPDTTVPAMEAAPPVFNKYDTNKDGKVDTAEALAAKEMLEAQSKLIPNLGGSGVIIDSPEDVLQAAKINAETANNQIDITASTGSAADTIAAKKAAEDAQAKVNNIINNQQAGEANANAQAAASSADDAKTLAQKAQDKADNLKAAGLTERAAAAQVEANALAAKIPQAEADAVAAQAESDTLYNEAGVSTAEVANVDNVGDKAGTSSATNNQKSEVLAAITKNIASINDGSADGKTESDAKTAVTDAGADGNDKVNKAESFLSGIFGDLFDTGELKRMAILYAGSRLMGASHGGSLNWAAKSYLTRVDAKSAAHAATVKELITGGKHTPKSINLFKKTKDYSVLVPKGVVASPTGTKEMWYSPEGRRIQAEKYKIGKDSYIWSDDGGKTAIPSSWHQQASRVPKTDEYNDRIKSEVPSIKNVIEEVATRIDVTPGDSARGIKRTQKTAIDPADGAMEVARWAAKNGIDVASASGYAKMAYQMAVEQSGGPNKTQPESLLPYLNQLKLQQDTGQSALFQVTKEDGKAVDMDAVKVEVLSNNILRLYGLEGNISDGRNRDAVNQFWTGAAEIWNNRVNENPDIVGIYQEKAGSNGTPFYAYAQEQLNLAMRNG